MTNVRYKLRQIVIKGYDKKNRCIYMILLRKVNTLIHNPWTLGQRIVECTWWLWSDTFYLKLYYFFNMKKLLSLKNPKTFNEKLQWLKLYDRNPLYTTLVDKYEVKKYVAGMIGEKHVAKVLGKWDSPEEVSFDNLPDRFVLKTTHGGGNNGVIIIKDKNSADINIIRKNLKEAMKRDIYKLSKEWPYKNVKRIIIAEEYLEDTKTGELRDYKFLCFNGVVRALYVATERQTREEPYFNFFDENYNSLEFTNGHPRADIPPTKPAMFEQMKAIAETLSKGLPHVRVDLYQADETIYFGEFTFYHMGGFFPFEPTSWDDIFGSWLQLPPKFEQQ